MRSEFIEVVVVTRNSAGHIGACVDSIVAGGGLPIIVDNGSIDDTLEIVRSRSREARIIATGENPGYGMAMNRGFQETKGECVILSNPDVVFLRDSIRQMTEFLAKNPRVGITGPQQMFPNRSWQRSYGDLPGIWSGVKDAVGITTLHNGARRFCWPRRMDRKPKEVPYVDGAVLAVRRQAYLRAGGFDKDFFLSADDGDLCARLKKAGWGVVFFPEAQVIHIRGGDTTKKDTSDRYVRFHVASHFLLASKHLPVWQARLFMWLERMQFRRLALTYRILRVLLWGPSVSRAEENIRMFEVYSKVIEEHLRSGSVAFPTETRTEGR